MKLLFKLVGLLAAVFLLYQLWLFGHILYWKWNNPSTTAFMTEQQAVLAETNPDIEIRYRWVSYDRISNNLKRALVASEDAKFLAHEGFDWEGMQTAWEKNMQKGRIVAGGSTISQQLAKNLFLSSKRTPWRKAEEAIITVMIEALWDKRRILEVYLNVVEWGNGIFGCEAAAQRYYRLPAAQLGPAQAARLAVMLPNPRKYEKTYGPRLAAHAARIQARMQYSEVP